MAARRTKRSDGRYAVTMRYEDPLTGERKRAYFYGRTQGEATVKAREARERLGQGAPVRDAARTLEDWLAEWCSALLPASDRARSTKLLYEGLLRLHVVPVIGQVTLDRLRPSHAAQVLLKLEDAGRSASTRRNAYAALRAALDDAVRAGLLASNPLHKLKRPRRAHTEARFLNLDEVQAFLGQTGHLRYDTALKVILGTGLRRGELLALRWSDVDLDRAEARVRGSLSRLHGSLVISPPKSARSRRLISLSPAVVALLRAHRTKQKQERLAAGNLWQGSPHVFTTELGGPVDPRNMLRAVVVAARRAGLGSDVGVHTLRHTYATTALLHAVPIHVVSRNLGHASIAITADVYGHLTDQAAQAAAETVANALGL